ncbi:hypothetical protein FRC08_009546 [Ceratobasidium sp. 394]|nr:hypothetical protein FRC08_009546 [Ceratobasidium sp. 394]
MSYGLLSCCSTGSRVGLKFSAKLQPPITGTSSLRWFLNFFSVALGCFAQLVDTPLQTWESPEVPPSQFYEIYIWPPCSPPLSLTSNFSTHTATFFNPTYSINAT